MPLRKAYEDYTIVKSGYDYLAMPPYVARDLLQLLPMIQKAKLERNDEGKYVYCPADEPRLEVEVHVPFYEVVPEPEPKPESKSEATATPPSAEPTPEAPSLEPAHAADEFDDDIPF